MLTQDAIDATLLQATRRVAAAADRVRGADRRSRLALYGKMPSVVYQDYPHAKLIVIWGMNPGVSGIHAVPYLRRRPEERRAHRRHRSARDGAGANGRSASRGAARDGRRRRARGAQAFVRDRSRRPGVSRRAHDWRGHAAREGGTVDVRTRGGGCRSQRDRPRDVRGVVRDVEPGADSLRLGPRAESQRRQRGDGGARAAGRRRQVRRPRRRLRDEQLRGLGLQQAVARHAGTADPRDQHEPARVEC